VYVDIVVTRASTRNANPDLFIDEGEALVFWLSMTDNDPRYPFLSYYNPNPGTQTANPKKYYPFEEQRLVHVPAPNFRGRNKPVNPTTFQILCAGQDGEFGDSLAADQVKLFPSGAFYEAADKDNITNFSDGRTLGDNIP
jgi:hypothetical protein